MKVNCRCVFLTMALYAASTTAYAQQPVLVPARVITPAISVGGGGVHRLGLNVDRESEYDARAILQNYLEDPGFEPATQSHLIIVGTIHSSARFADSNNPYDPEATSFWNGASASVRSGVSAGKTFKVQYYTAGGYYTCTPSCPTLGQGDLIGEELTGPTVGVISGSALGPGWEPQDTSWTISTAEQEAGAASALANVSDGKIHSLNFYGDSASSTVGICSNRPSNVCQGSADCGGKTCNLWPYYPMHPISGSMTASIWALACGNGCGTASTGTPTLNLEIWRSGSSWSSVSKSFTLTNDHRWHQYSYTFTGADKNSDTSIWGVGFTVRNGAAQTNAKIYVDNAFFGPTSSPSAAPAWTTPAYQTMQTLNPGVLRYMTGWGSFNTLPETSYDGSDYTRGPGYWCSHALCDDYTDWTLGSQDVYQMAGALNADPWLSIPNIWSDAEVNAFAGHLCSAFRTYGFTHAEVEQSNEDWASSAVDAGGGDSNGYGALANRNFALINKYMSNNCPAYAGDVYFVAGGQESNSWVTRTVTAQLPSNNPHYGTALAAYVASENPQPAGETMGYYAALGMDNSLNQFTSGIEDNGLTNSFPADLGQMCGGTPSGCRQFTNIYENGNGNECGTTTRPATSPVEGYQMSAGWMAAGINAQNWILGFMAGTGGPNSGTLMPVPIQNTFNFAEHEYLTPNWECAAGQASVLSALWGITEDFNPQFGPPWNINGGHLRPIGVMEALFNQAIPQGGSYYEVTGLPSGVFCADFTASGSNLHRLICANSNKYAQAVAVTFPSNAVLPKTARTVGYTYSMGDTNEDSAAVRIVPESGAVGYGNRTGWFTIPAFSGMALTK
jgi:hypothetical protein